jgi:thioredoxin 1
MLIKIYGETHFQQEIDKGGVQIIKFGAAWCAPCKEVDKVLNQLQDEIPETILQIDVDLDPEIAGEFQIMSIPTILFVKDKQVKSGVVGLQTKEGIKKAIDAINEEA